MSFQIYSVAFNPGDPIPTLYTGDGADVSPPLAWTDPPDGTRSFTLLVSDPDAPRGIFCHWAVYDIPADTRRLPERFPTTAHVGAIKQAVNDFGRTGYGGPCPPPHHGPHRYYFELLALGVAQLDVSLTAKGRDVEAAAAPHLLARASLMGRYGRR